jgi:hypothetical protein
VATAIDPDLVIDISIPGERKKRGQAAVGILYQKLCQMKVLVRCDRGKGETFAASILATYLETGASHLCAHFAGAKRPQNERFK